MLKQNMKQALDKLTVKHRRSRLKCLSFQFSFKVLSKDVALCDRSLKVLSSFECFESIRTMAKRRDTHPIKVLSMQQRPSHELRENCNTSLRGPIIFKFLFRLFLGQLKFGRNIYVLYVTQKVSYDSVMKLNLRLNLIKTKKRS